jgi:hypothetical protein
VADFQGSCWVGRELKVESLKLKAEQAKRRKKITQRRGDARSEREESHGLD